MDKKEYTSALVATRQANKFLRMVVGVLAVSNLTLSYFVLTADTSEKTILVPPSFEKPMTFAGSELSPAYLEEMGRYFGGLLLTWHKANAMSQFEQVLNYVDSAAYPVLRDKFNSDFKRISRSDLSSVFFINGIDVKKGTVILKGVQQLKVGSQTVSQDQKFYELQFSYTSGRLVITSYKELRVNQLNELVPVDSIEKVMVEVKEGAAQVTDVENKQ